MGINDSETTRDTNDVSSGIHFLTRHMRLWTKCCFGPGSITHPVGDHGRDVASSWLSFLIHNTGVILAPGSQRYFKD